MEESSGRGGLSTQKMSELSVSVTCLYPDTDLPRSNELSGVKYMYA